MILGDNTALTAFAELGQWILRFLDERAASGGDSTPDFVSSLLHGTVDGEPLSRDHQFQTFLLTLFGGLETTTGALAYAVRQIALRPELQTRLASEEALLDPAIEEFLRLEPPAPWFARTATRDAELAGQKIRAGDRVAMCLAGANRDPQAFERPDEVDIARAGNRHLAFGAGPHRCVGIHLARAEMRIALRTILARLHDIAIEPDAALDYRAHHARGLARLPIIYQAV
jgi:cytochrome P450